MENSFPSTLTALRKANGLTQKEAAKQLGISQALLSHYENGIRECSLDFLIKTAKFYNVSCDELLGLVSTEPEDEKNAYLCARKDDLTDALEIMFDLLARSQNQSVCDEAADFISLAIYRIMRLIYFSSQSPARGVFNLSKHTYRAMADAQMQISEADLLCALSGKECDDLLPVENPEALKINGSEMKAVYGEKYLRLLELISLAEKKVSHK